jgi:hypothetical protein
MPFSEKDKKEFLEEIIAQLKEVQSKAEGKYGEMQSLLYVFGTFSQIKWKDVFFGLAGIKIVTNYLPVMSKAMVKMLEPLEGKDFKESMKGMYTFINALSKFGEIKWGRIMFGLTILGLLSAGMGIFALIGPVMIAGAVLFGEFAKLMGKAIGAFFKALPFGAIVKGLLLLAGLAVSLALLAGSFIIFSKVSWKDVFIGLGAIAAFSALAAILGLAIEFIAPGLIVLAGLGAALIVLGLGFMAVGKGLKFMAEGIKEIGDTLPEMADTFERMAGMSLGLLKTAAALAVLSAAIVAFSVATAAGNIGGAVAGAISGVINWATGSKSTSPIDQLARLASMSDALHETADAIERINAAIKAMPSKAGADLSMLSTTGAELTSQRGVAAAGGYASGGGGKNISAPVSNKISSVVVNNSFMPDRSTALVLAPVI